jgi:hypothetical protein
MSKVVISVKENKALYKDFGRTVEAYKLLNPDKYTSLERICYLDLINDILMPFMAQQPCEYLRTEEQLEQEAHVVWSQLVKNGDIDRFCQVISKKEG